MNEQMTAALACLAAIALSACDGAAIDSSTDALKTLDVAAGKVAFVSTKDEGAEVPGAFSRLTGSLQAPSGDLSRIGGSLSIDLTTLSTGIIVRDDRIRELFFETSRFATATYTIDRVDGLPSGPLDEDTRYLVEATGWLTLHGVAQPLTASLSVQRVSDATFHVATVEPMSVRIDAFDLGFQLAALMTTCGTIRIDNVVSVTLEADLTLAP